MLIRNVNFDVGVAALGDPKLYIIIKYINQAKILIFKMNPHLSKINYFSFLNFTEKSKIFQ